jgi:hypothetical protein
VFHDRILQKLWELLVQAVVPLEVAAAVGGLKELTASGTSVLLEGTLAETPPGTKQVPFWGRNAAGMTLPKWRGVWA